jgi:hypothetical protein
MIKKEHDCFEADNRTERHKTRPVQAGLDVGLSLTTSAGSSLVEQGRLFDFNREDTYVSF